MPLLRQPVRLHRRHRSRLGLLELDKVLPWNAVWDYFCLKNGVPVGMEAIEAVEKYEKEVTSKR